MTAVITGMGLVLPCGDGIDAARTSWKASAHAFSTLPPSLGEGLGGWCCRFNEDRRFSPLGLRRLDRASRYALRAAAEALEDAQVPQDEYRGLGVALGTLTGGLGPCDEFFRPYLSRGLQGVSPLVYPNCVANAPAGHVSIGLGIRGPAITVVDTENATFQALDQALRWLELGFAPAVLVIGTDGLFPLQVELLQEARRYSRSLPEAGKATGLLAGEGAEAFVLELEDHAVARGARIRGRILGLESAAGLGNSKNARREALARAVAMVATMAPERWVGGGSGLPTLDDVELPLVADRPKWPVPRFPKTLWGEFTGAGGQVLAAALLEEGRVLVTFPASTGVQGALLLETPNSKLPNTECIPMKP